jgi:Ran GTPase-activating protein (RanGAP) involved in mRNA processing and transport
MKLVIRSANLLNTIRIWSLFTFLVQLPCFSHVDNKIGCRGTTSIAKALRKNTTLTELDLNNNQISDESVLHLGHALKDNSNLTYLNLNYNNIGPDSLEAFAFGLSHNQSIQTLHLSHNKIQSGVAYLGESLKCNQSLTELSLSSLRKNIYFSR